MATVITALGCAGPSGLRSTSMAPALSIPQTEEESSTQLVGHQTSLEPTTVISAQAAYVSDDAVVPSSSSRSNTGSASPMPLSPTRTPTNLNSTILEPESTLLVEEIQDSSYEPVNLKDASEVNRLAQQLRWAGDYQIETGDSLEIKFRAAKELNDVTTVRPDGMISLQLVGDQLAEGLTPEQLRAQLEQAYAKDLVNPDLVVIVRSFSGNSIYIGGEVLNPVRIPLTGRVTTLKAVILAGGFKDTADKKRVIVRREDGTCCSYNLKDVVECRGGQDIELLPYDVVYVPKSTIAKINLFVEQYIVKVLPFSNSFGVFVSHNTGLSGGVVGP